MGKRIISSEKLLSLVAMIVGLGTLLVFMYQTNLIREHQYMSVYPYLSIQYNNSNNEFSYIIQNKGIGPAIVKSVYIVDSNGKEYADVVGFMQYVFKENDLHFAYSYSSVKIGDLISEKEIIKMLSIKNLESSSVQTFFGVLAKKDIRFEVIYESIYGEQWKIINDGKPPVKIE